jgi:peptidyl-prolyl cis-trans isomerase D
MSVIQKIRTKYAKLAGFVIALALVGFILMDAFSGRFGDYFRGGSDVAKVNGNEIDYKDYQKRIQDYEVLYAYSSQGRGIDDATRAQINEQALNELIYEDLLKDESEKLGITSTPEEEKDMIYGASPDPIIRQYPAFTNQETGMFDPQRIRMFEQQVDQLDPSGKAKQEWETLKSYVLRMNVQKKYNTILTKAMYIPKFLVERQIKQQGQMASVKFVKVPFATINDNEVKVTDDELIAYMKKREPLYYIDKPTRSIEYVSFDVLPSAEDTAKSLGALQQLKAEFASAEDAQSFVNRNSDEQYKDAYVNKKTFMSAYADSIMNTATGSIYGPYFEGGTYKLTKVLEKKSLPDSVVCRHILVKTENGGQPVLADSLAKKRIDSAVAAIRGGASFDTMVQRISDDDGSKSTGGEYTFTLQQKEQLSKEFGDFIFDGGKGQNKVVKVDNDGYAGYHYIEILDQKGIAPAAKLATITKQLYAGENTDRVAYSKANEFAGRNTTEKAFDEAVKSNNYEKKVAENVFPNSFMIPGIGNAREVVRWMYDAKIGDVSPVFQMDGRYVVAKLTSKKDKGLMGLDANNRPTVEAAARAEKKGKIIADKYKTLNNLDAIAQASKQPVMQADSFSASSPFVPNLGYEPKAVGYSFYDGFKPNATSPAIQGQDGVIFMSLLGRFEKPVPNDENAIMQNRNMMDMQLRSSVSSGVQELLRNKADVEYNTKNL